MPNHKFSWLNSKLYVKDIKKYGKGVFTKKDIRKGEILIIFGGYVISNSQYYQLPKRIQEIPLDITKKFLLGPVKKNELAVVDYVNHSCNPNTGFMGQIILVAMRNIKKREEITFDYAMCCCYDNWKMKCLCGSGNCRGVITGSDWKDKSLQKNTKVIFSHTFSGK